MGSCQPGQGRKSAAIRSPLQVRWASHRQPMASMSEPANTSADTTGGPAAPAAPPRHYVVVARRYRPQTFDELIGQEHVAQALSNAIATQRVGHAYLFTGARGVGKTSAARILAKALNCEQGPTRRRPATSATSARASARGDDVDVLEIDGASNRGIDEIRQLRQNVNVRPSRARFKIYIIDEVHMLTREAFNALLKTLEEPPEHVKFIFCTTEATKIPDHDPLALPALRLRRHLDAVDLRAAAADRRGRRGRGRGRGPGGARPPGRRLDARQPVAAGATAVVRLGADHRGRRARHARHRRRSAAGGPGEAPGRAQRGRRLGRTGRRGGRKASTWPSCSSNCFGYFRDCMVGRGRLPGRGVPLRLGGQRPRGGRGRAAAGPANDPGGHADPRSDARPDATTARKAASWPNWPWSGFATGGPGRDRPRDRAVADRASGRRSPRAIAASAAAAGYHAAGSLPAQLQKKTLNRPPSPAGVARRRRPLRVRRRWCPLEPASVPRKSGSLAARQRLSGMVVRTGQAVPSRRGRAGPNRLVVSFKPALCPGQVDLPAARTGAALRAGGGGCDRRACARSNSLCWRQTAAEAAAGQAGRPAAPAAGRGGQEPPGPPRGRILRRPAAAGGSNEEFGIRKSEVGKGNDEG